MFAEYIRGANIKKLEEAIIETRDGENIYKFARDIKGVNIKNLEDAIIETGDVNFIYYFAIDIKGANIIKLNNARKQILERQETKKKPEEIDKLVDQLIQ